MPWPLFSSSIPISSSALLLLCPLPPRRGAQDRPRRPPRPSPRPMRPPSSRAQSKTVHGDEIEIEADQGPKHLLGTLGRDARHRPSPPAGARPPRSTMALASVEARRAAAASTQPHPRPVSGARNTGARRLGPLAQVLSERLFSCQRANAGPVTDVCRRRRPEPSGPIANGPPRRAARAWQAGSAAGRPSERVSVSRETDRSSRRGPTAPHSDHSPPFHPPPLPDGPGQARRHVPLDGLPLGPAAGQGIGPVRSRTERPVRAGDKHRPARRPIPTRRRPWPRPGPRVPTRTATLLPL